MKIEFARRPALDGVRGLAALLVLFYHAQFPGFSRGFLGVDIFFALFGFLLASILLVELNQTNGISLGRYYYRRARRLLPLSLFVLLSSAIVERLIGNPLHAMEHRLSFLSAALYFANWKALFDASDYFASTSQVPPSPVMHYWSLSVEEVRILINVVRIH